MEYEYEVRGPSRPTLTSPRKTAEKNEAKAIVSSGGQSISDAFLPNHVGKVPFPFVDGG
jgi:hypothetical protein